MNMIEKVALTLVNKARARHNVPLFNSIESMIENLTPEALIEYKGMAKAAIEAMREPSDCMIVRSDIKAEYVRPVWQEMIDAALKEE